MRHLEGLIAVVLWIGTLALWLALAFNTKRTIARRGVTVRLAFVALIVVVVAGRSARGTGLHRVLWHASDSVGLAAVVLIVAGCAFAVWARLTIGSNWSGSVTLKQDHELIQRGPYALARHPIYTGLLTMFVGSILLTGLTGLVIGVPIVLVALFLKVREEERLMSDAFPSAYPEYRKRVKAVIPFVV